MCKLERSGGRREKGRGGHARVCGGMGLGEMMGGGACGLTARCSARDPLAQEPSPKLKVAWCPLHRMRVCIRWNVK